MPRDRARALEETLRGAVLDERVLATVAATPRTPFVPPSQRSRAFENRPLPIGGGQTISQPLVVARMCELLDVRPGHRVLDVGTGSGWHAALLARLGGHVLSVERDAALSATAGEALREAGVDGVELMVGDGFGGVPERAPYDRINVAAASPPEALRALEDQLADRGRLVAPLGNGRQRLVVTQRDGDRFERWSLEPVRFVPLVPGLASSA
jgi:protein-L-isoaspartate(D-aspartate) O-methyltransferase